MESHQGIISHYAVDLLIVFMTSYSDTFIKDLKEVTQYDDDFSELMKKAKQLSDDLQLKDDGEKYKQDLEGYRKKIPEIKEKAFIETASKKLYDFRKKKLLVWKDDFGDKTYKYQKAEGIPSTQLKSDIVHSGLMKTIIAAFDEKDYLKSFFEERNHDDRKKFFQNFVNQAAQVDDLIIENIHLTMKQAINDINAHQWDKMMGVNKEGKEINIGHGYKKEMLDYVEVLKADLKKLFDDIKDDFKKDGIFAAKKD